MRENQQPILMRVAAPSIRPPCATSTRPADIYQQIPSPYFAKKPSSSNQISSRKKILQNDTVPTYQNDAVALYQPAADLFKTSYDRFQLQHPKFSVLTSSNDVSAPTTSNPVDTYQHQQLHKGNSCGWFFNPSTGRPILVTAESYSQHSKKR
ncbi:pentatricopeptide repeat-containing protein-like [Dorcoceras hygrometricum]|uniref:Pentatricopeptide repeat-containing protein-like n=1 Tax=Dorcoceras hygrometricum TaxID=472368 RepID=A0A2Z7BDK3_9LAMI|nr:pentatricopeptide repeat-containing protein-like [Dorcoceras hygrometricum]